MERLVGLAEGALLTERYEILAEIGRGERSFVYEALDREHDRTVALKLLSPPAASAHLVRKRLINDLRRARQFDHPCTVPIGDVFEHGPWIAIVMERIAGPDLEARVTASGGLPVEEVSRAAAELAEVLGAAHRQGLLHRDVKPRNVLVDALGRARLVDFGCARLEGQTLLVEVDEPVNTVGFLPPEVIAGRHADARTDLYALGMTLYFALVGRVPPGPGPHLPPPPRAAGYHPRERRPDIPSWLDAIIARATSAEPADRFESAEALIAALEARAPQGRSTDGADPNLLDVCVLCREPGTLGRAVCPHCEDDGPADTLVLLARPDEPGELADRLRILAGLTERYADAPELRQIARGELPIVRVSRRLAHRIAQRLAAHGLAARLIAAQNAWSALPRRAHWSTAGIIAAGFVAGTFNAPLLLAAALLMAAASVPCAHLWMQRAALLRPVPGPHPPGALVRKVCEVMPQLETGEARRLLVEVLRLARDVERGLDRASGARDARRALTGALIAAADVARVVASIDPVLAALQLHGEDRFEPPPGLVEAVSLYETARVCAVQSLLEACGTLSGLRNDELLDVAAVQQQMARIGHALSEDAAIASEMTKEALGLFSAGGPS